MGAIRETNFSFDGKLLLSCSDDKTLKGIEKFINFDKYLNIINYIKINSLEPSIKR